MYRFYGIKIESTRVMGSVESMGGVAVRALVSHHCDPGPIPGFGVICELSLLLILSLASRVFPRVLRFSFLRKNQHSYKFQFDHGRAYSYHVLPSSKQRLFIYLFILYILMILKKIQF
jgi:hypothetical protein